MSDGMVSHFMNYFPEVMIIALASNKKPFIFILVVIVRRCKNPDALYRYVIVLTLAAEHIGAN